MLTSKQIALGDAVLNKIEGLVIRFAGADENVAYAGSPDDTSEPGWNQDSWRCETGMCFAGWTVDQTPDARWLFKDPSSAYAEFVVPGRDFDWAAFDALPSFSVFRATVGRIRRNITMDYLGENWNPSTNAIGEELLAEIAEYADDRRILSASTFARVQLGLGRFQADELFSGRNSLSSLREIWGEIKDGSDVDA